MSENRIEGLHCGYMVDSSGECTELVASHQMSAAYDILTDAGFSPETSTSLTAAADKLGVNLEEIARKMARFKRIFTEDPN